MMNEIYVSFAPASSYSVFFACRICATRVKFTSNTECTWADVRRLMIMCSAIFLRITDIGCTWPGTPLPRGGGPGVGRDGGPGGGADDGTGLESCCAADADPPDWAMKSRISRFVTRPAIPVPRLREKSPRGAPATFR